jgi:outer membrane phospholipase A
MTDHSLFFVRWGSAVRVLVALVGVLSLSGAVMAQNLAITLLAPSGPVAPASIVPMDLLAVNSGGSAVSFEPPPVLQAQVWQGERSWSVNLKALTESGATVLPGGFSKRQYVFTLPTGAAGRVILEISQGLQNPVRAVISVASPDGRAVAQDVSSAAVSAPTRSGQAVVSSLPRGFIGHFSALEPIYFIYGSKGPAAKFQFSFKYRVFSFDRSVTDAPEQSLQFGYTQRSLWDINATSSPFYDTSYMPALFYQFMAPAPDADQAEGGLKWLGFQSGYQHESNGKDSVESRSLNTLFVRSGLLFGRPDRWHALLQLRVFGYVGGLTDNPNLEDYRGYSDWKVTLVRGDGPSLSYTGRAGKDFNHFSSQLDLVIPVRTRRLDIATYLLIQYFDGYGESLRGYDKSSSTVRAGFALVR